MARIRQIRPEFWSDEKVTRLSIAARLTMIALLNFADDSGRGRAYPRELAGFAFPIDDIDIKPLIEEIASIGIIHIYEAEGLPLFHFPKWRKHQKIERPTPSRLPNPDDLCIECRAGLLPKALTDVSVTAHRTLTESSVTAHRTLTDDSVIDRGVVPPQEAGSRNQEVGKRNQDHVPPGRSLEENDVVPFEAGEPPVREPDPEEIPADDREPAPPAGPRYTPEFLAFWEAYPAGERKTAKAKTFDAWRKKHKLGAAHLPRVLAALEEDKGSRGWLDRAGAFVPAPLSWLGKCRWLDEPLAAAATVGASPPTFTDRW